MTKTSGNYERCLSGGSGLRKEIKKRTGRAIASSVRASTKGRRGGRRPRGKLNVARERCLNVRRYQKDSNSLILEMVVRWLHSRAGQISRIFLRRNATLTRLTRLPSQPVRKIVPPLLPSELVYCFARMKCFRNTTGSRTQI